MNLNTRKSQGMPINVIIIAALALVVLFVLIMIFTNQTGKTVSSLESCAGKQGQCKEKCESNEALVVNTDCSKLAKDKKSKEDKCCVQVFSP